MKHILFFTVLTLTPQLTFAKSVTQLILQQQAKFQAIYEHLHMNPELSEQEKETSALVASEMESLGYEVTRNVGGYGVVGVLYNGSGPTVMIRADMDALPLQEQTGLPYASKVPGVMHACGHDMHTTILLGTAHVLANSRTKWSGTLVLVAQPAEEVGKGAIGMINDGLFTRFPKPNYGLALHILGRGLKETIYYRSGFTYAANDFFEVTHYGKGTHGANPHTGIDPWDLFVQFKLFLNNLISREIDPLEPAVATIGKVEGDSKNNIIPDFLKSYGIIRYYNPAVGEKLRLRIEQGAKGISQMAGAAVPEVKFSSHMDPVFNDHSLTKELVSVFETQFDKKNVKEISPNITSEDFAAYGQLGGFPTVIFFVGTSEKLPAEFVNHSPKYAPSFDPTYPTGVRAMVEAVLHMQKRP